MNAITRLWQRLQKVAAPAAVPALVIAPAVPMRQEQFPNIPGQRAASAAQDERLAALYQRVVRANNANVTRDFGRGPAVIHHDSQVPALTAEERGELAEKRAGVKFVAAKPKTDFSGLLHDFT